jgi:hypothetical protein
MTSEAKTLTEDNAQEVAQWCGGRAVIQHDALDHDVTTPGVNVPVGDSVQRAQVGDMVIRNDDGSFQIFKKEG